MADSILFIKGTIARMKLSLDQLQADCHIDVEQKDRQT